VYSHGLNRFPAFVSYIRQGVVDVHAEPKLAQSFGVLEQWDGLRGPGNLNARFSMARAIELARRGTIGCVALRNTNHWMRAGSYGWQAAEAGVIGVGWTNTIPNLPPWGAKAPRVGNNPLFFAVPRPGGHVVLDMAMSLYSYGKLGTYRLAGRELPVEGGYDERGNLTRDPAAILKSSRLLPAGYWKGSGLSLVLDMTAAILSGGAATWQFDKTVETGASQMFIAFDASRLGAEYVARVAREILSDFHRAEPAEPGERVYYPGERTLLTRQESLAQGVVVEESIWRQVVEEL
jgi:3-dehydro-L-gulonate 2-dehydrogenase